MEETNIPSKVPTNRKTKREPWVLFESDFIVLPLPTMLTFG